MTLTIGSAGTSLATGVVAGARSCASTWVMALHNARAPGTGGLANLGGPTGCLAAGWSPGFEGVA